MRLVITKLLDIISNVKWDLIFYLKLIFNSDFRKHINANVKFRNSARSNRCFIIGNGPSLKLLDLKKLKDEVVFTVNNIMSDQEIYQNLNTDYHVFIDPTYYNLDNNIPEDKVTIGLLAQINYENKKPECIVFYKGKEGLRKTGIDKILKLNYIFQHRTLTYSYSSKISMCKNMPASQNVIQTAIYSAIYMGYKQIYLVGCDMTSLFLTYVASDTGGREISNSYHAYKYTDSEKRTMLRDSKNYDNEYMLYDYAKTFTIFKRIRRYAERNKIEIYNATKGGGLDVFRRLPYESLF
jgi:hypothetical protein